jgi:hypothetical protein
LYNKSEYYYFQEDKAEGEEKRSHCVVTGTEFIITGENIALKVLRPCPLVLAKVGWRQGRAL